MRIAAPLLLAICLLPPGLLEAADQRIEFFEKRIRPLLVHHCQECHGSDQQEGKLRLDSMAGWKRGGKTGPAIVPGDPSSSLLVKAVSYQDDRLKMPPDKKDQLSRQQVEDIMTWIRQGAIDPRTGTSVAITTRGMNHWAFQPIRSAKIKKNAHPVDDLIEKQLRKKKFTPTPPANHQALIRRMTYDLHGLPPTRDQLATEPGQLDALIDSLLASPRYGERWARHWLDVARYADAKDGVLMYGDARIRPFAYTYRDYVIRAFNDDKPFDRFIREQIAADKLGLPADAPEHAAMGLLTLGRMFDRNRHDVIDDQIDTITRGFLGLTVSCARCHDHKFDPIPTADYYSLYGVFASSIEPYNRPRVGTVSEEGRAYETELEAKLTEVFDKRQQHYEFLLQTARDRTPDYLVQIASTEPDLSETAIFFLSLIPEQLRPQITYRWRQLIARRAFPDDPVFGPWHDLMKDPTLQVESWKKRAVDPRIIAGLAEAQPRSPEEIARVYGQVIRSVWSRELEIDRELEAIKTQRSALSSTYLNLADLVAGGNGFGTGKRGHAIEPVNGTITGKSEGFVDIQQHDTLIPVPASQFVDGVFIPKTSTAIISTTGLTITDLPATSGQTWDYFRFGPSGGFTVNTIDGVDYNQPPQWMLALHANKGITFDLSAIRDTQAIESARFKALLGHGGEKGTSSIDFFVYLDGKRVHQVKGFLAQQPGSLVDLPLSPDARFLTLVVTEAGQGLSHDQAILGNPRITFTSSDKNTSKRTFELAKLAAREESLRAELGSRKSLLEDPLGSLLLSRESPVWFPIDKTYNYLSRQDKDAFRGLVNQIDSISVKHKAAAPRAMVMIDDDPLVDPVIFQRGDPTQRGTPVPRQFLQIASPVPQAPFAHGSGRLDLANAIASKDNPLTARVWVNRVWMHHFGEPLVENPSDFGLRTTQPVQHELLDYLAHVLIRSGWKTKSLHRLIMSSAVYQRSSETGNNSRYRNQGVQDPTNQYLWRAHRRRLDLEQMRDTFLMVSGQLENKLYGRPGLITDMDFNRRTIYTFIERQNVPSVVKVFDAANPDTSTARRVNTTVPQQALFAMNSTFISRSAKLIAEQATAEKPVDRIIQIYQAVLGRAPGADEITLGVEFTTTSPWENYAHALLMTNELMFID